MKKLNLIALLVAFLTVSALSHGEGSSEPNGKALVAAYYESIDALSATDASVADVDRIFAYFTDGFTYEHPRYGGLYTKERLYQGFVTNLQRGAYRDQEPTVVTNMIEGLDVVMTERSSGKVTLFELEEGKIARIKEYW